MTESLILLIQDSLRKNWNELALTDLHGASFQYRDVARKIAKLHLLFEKAGIKPGDKIALCGKNSAHWGVAFLGTITYGAVAVPILHEFKPENIHHLVTHSDSRLLFVSHNIYDTLNIDSMPNLEGALLIDDFSLLESRNKNLTDTRAHLNEYFGKRYPERFSEADVNYPVRQPDDLAIISYTSGSTGFSKGVMLSHRNLWSNVQYCIEGLTFLKPGDGLVCMLPLAHMFGLVVELLHSTVKGCHANFITRPPSPKVLLEAFAIVQPKLILTVPLVIEKIIRGKVFPTIDKPLMKLLLHVPVIDDRILSKIRAKLIDVFGSKVREVIIGGAALNKDVEKFLRRIRFPYTVGYGMTECGPLIAYSPWESFAERSCGRIVNRMSVSVDSDDPANRAGELLVKGENVMMGYYKNPEATREVLDKDGTLHTGDLGTIDADGNVYIRGRSKSMILGPSGQNIYPEEIEQKLNNLPYVGESLVIDRDGQLVALIHPNLDETAAAGLTPEQIETIMNENVAKANVELPPYSRIAHVKLMEQEFEKTPKHSIKRYLYTQ